MDRPSDELLERLLAAANGAADERVARLLADASAEAEAEVRHLIKGAMTAAMLRRAVAHLEGTPAPSIDRSTEPAPTPAHEPARQEEVPPGATYVYCIARRSDLDERILQGMVGVDDAFAPRAVTDGGLAAIVSSVSPDTFDEATMAERVKDFEWVGQKVRAHDQIIKRAMETGPVIPLRFGTVVRSEDDVLQLLGGHREELGAALERLVGKKEWGVKVRARASELARSTRSTPDETSETGAGRTYLLERTRGDRARASIRAAVRECVQEVHAKLTEIAQETSLLPLSRPLAADGGEDDEAELVLNGAYLVADADTKRFDALVTSLSERFAPQGFQFELTGPWPAYNFVGVDLSSSGGGAS